MSETSRFRALRTGATVGPAALAVGCSSGNESKPESSKPRPTVTSPSTAPSTACNTASDERSLTVDATAIRDLLNGEAGSEPFKASWHGVQISVEDNLADMGVPQDTRVKVSAAIGPMITNAERSEASLIEGDAADPGGQMTDSRRYTFIRDPAERDDPSAPPQQLILEFTPDPTTGPTDPNCETVPPTDIL